MPASTLRKPTAIASAVALLAGGAVAYTASANGTKSASATRLVQTSKSGSYNRPSAADMQAQRDLYDAELAKALGVDVAKVKAAQKTAREAVFVAGLDARVKAGQITQAQADELRAAAASGKLEETLKAQHRAELVTRLAEAVKAGRLTQAQSDAMLKQFDAAPAGGMGPGGFGHHEGFDGLGGPGGFGDHHRGGFRP